MRAYIAALLPALGGGALLYLPTRAAALLNAIRPRGLWSYKAQGPATLCVIREYADRHGVPAVHTGFPHGMRHHRGRAPGLLRSAGRYTASTLRGRRTILLLGTIARTAFIGQPIRYDEAPTCASSTMAR